MTLAGNSPPGVGVGEVGEDPCTLSGSLETSPSKQQPHSLVAFSCFRNKA